MSGEIVKPGWEVPSMIIGLVITGRAECVQSNTYSSKR